MREIPKQRLVVRRRNSFWMSYVNFARRAAGLDLLLSMTTKWQKRYRIRENPDYSSYHSTTACRVAIVMIFVAHAFGANNSMVAW